MQHPSYRIIIDNDHKASSSSSSSSTAPFPTCTLSRVPRVPRASSPRPTMVPPVKDPYRRHRSTLPPASPPAIPPRSLARPDALLINTQEQTPSLNPQSPTLVATLATDTDATATTATSLAITVQPLTRKEVKECKICFEEFEWISLLHLQHPEEAPPLPPSPPTSPEVVEDDAVDLGSIEFDLAEQQVILQEIQQQRQQQRQSSSSSSSSSSSQPPLDPPSISLSTTSSSSSLSSHTSSWDETSSPSSFSSSSLPRPLSTLPPLSSIAPPTSSSSHQHSTAGGTKSRHPLASLFTRYKNRSSGGNNPLGIYYSSSPSGHSRSVVDLPIFKYSAFRVGRPDPSPRPPTPEFSVTLRASTFPLSPASSPPPSPPSKTPEAMKLGGSLPCGQDHLFCFECLSRHVATQVQARAWPVLCPAENCREAIEDPFLIEMFLGGEANLWHSTAMEYAVKDKVIIFFFFSFFLSLSLSLH
ncbi:hypothetical protein EMPS_10495 [Entomortierella parvispora]|uniref:Uncharacterized protein n=1 Tax=Entomortierella parvispora TaxID=205924 RepID=A0A9P3HK67_9FUNG|nr:hypothetical protein EMPS_10495 [Entomortierella parvispora]